MIQGVQVRRRFVRSAKMDRLCCNLDSADMLSLTPQNLVILQAPASPVTTRGAAIVIHETTTQQGCGNYISEPSPEPQFFHSPAFSNAQKCSQMPKPCSESW